MNSLQDVLDSAPDLVDHFYNDTKPKNFRLSAAGAALMPLEYTNWRDEQRAWRESSVLFNQSHIMSELHLSGPGSLDLLSSVAVNSMSNWSPERAKQIVTCTPSGNVISDCICYRLGEDRFELISGTPAQNWIAYHAETGGFDVEVRSDPMTIHNRTGRRERFRFQMEGPHTAAILDSAIEGGLPEVGFFRTVTVRIGGCEVLMLRHGMAGNLGAELSGDFDDMARVEEVLLRAGEGHDLRQGGSRAYYSTLFESGWMAYPLPGIYTDPALKDYRSWLPAHGWEANVAPAGSFRPDSIEEYYTTPGELGYGHIIKFDHDFIGHDALLRLRDEPRRRKVTLVWNSDDVLRVISSEFQDGPRYKSLERPVVYYGSPQADEVRTASGELVGISSHCGFTSNVRRMISLALVDEEYAEPGSEVVITWGEPDGGSRKPHVERHVQTQIRAMVAPVPYAPPSQDGKRAVLR